MATHESQDTADPRIPAPAAAIVDLLNSRPHATPALPDTLDDPRQAGAILSPFDPTAEDAPTPVRLERVRAVRDHLIAVLAADTPARTAQAWTMVTEQGNELTFRQTFTPDGQPQLLQVSGDPVVGRIVLTVAELVNASTWSRLRICGNDMCSRVFYDTTRSRTQRWHSYEICGNRTNVAAYRARARGSRTSGD
ncbi:CGNR zinc finger domain-containing protein [Micromonospora parathelypteridis]|uniref:Putative RNA-binding Zn ribbon-like protein n=1 Tax=Micromonospora parathelypteridis TaxID=1839617 RepID=A0A840VSA9_9ACTN|nr:CGNR zinc finger domain-containing protein [Micromonospora parathelypteridis]MBB5480022.1 putative RNA-binding Zn ribbon-like protein [Micromonospora parathelypteridis]